MSISITVGTLQLDLTSSDESSPAFEEFLTCIGDKVALKGGIGLCITDTVQDLVDLQEDSTLKVSTFNSMN
jgi:hypothetical protein